MIRSVKFSDGKYEFVFNDQTCYLECLRYGKPWRDFVGDKAVGDLMCGYFEQQDEIARLKAEIELMRAR